MAKYNLDSGFLILYDWMPALESMTYEEVGKLLFVLIDRQRYDKPLPEFDNAQTSIYARMIEPTIKRRLEGQENAAKKHTRSADHVPNPVPTPVPIPEQGVLRKEEKREEEISGDTLSPPAAEDTEEVVAEKEPAESNYKKSVYERTDYHNTG